MKFKVDRENKRRKQEDAYKLLDSLDIMVVDEQFSSDYSKQTHYNKHVVTGNNKEKKVFHNINQDEYEALADTLAITPVDNKNIFGYESEDISGKISYVKWNKTTEVFVAYTYDEGNPDPIIKSCYVKTFREYNGDKTIQYMGEIPQGR